MKFHAKLTLTAVLMLLVMNSSDISAQTSIEDLIAHPEYTGGVHLNYPEPSGKPTKAPKGYKPFFINHIARHGSRYLVWEPNYTQPLEALRKADSLGVLTPLGKDVLGRCEAVWEEAHDRIGELTPLGVLQHRGVAERMYRNYPSVFSKGAHVVARSTTVPRCMLSMMACCDRLKELEPTLDMTKTASGRDALHIASTGRKYTEYKRTHKSSEKVAAFFKEHRNSERFVASLISDKAYADTAVNGQALMTNLFATAYIQQDCPKPVELMDIFTNQERIDMWQCGNLGFYINNGPSPESEGMNRFSQMALLRDFIHTADDAIENGGVAASLRFSHDSYILPFTNTLMLSDCSGEASEPEDLYKVWCDFKVCPMCANVQMIFYRNKAGNVIVKFLHNENEVGIPVETDMYPFYNWSDVKAFYQKEYDYDNDQSL